MRLLSFLFLFVTVNCLAQPRLERHYSCKKYTTYEGLVQSQVNRMVQDNKGYIWICTKGGLSRFDGKNFQNFVDEKDGQRINIQNIFEQKNDYFVCSGTKLWRFTYEEENPENWRYEDLKLPEIYRFAEMNFPFFNETDSSLYLFNLREPGYLFRQFIHIKFNIYSGKTSVLPFGDKKMLCSFNEKDQRILINTDSKITLNNGSFIVEKLPFSINAITPDPTDSTFIAYQKSAMSLFRFDKTITKYKLLYDNVLINDDAPTTFVVNNSGYIIFIRDHNGINFIHQNRENQIDKVTLAKCLLVDRENNLWVGTEEGVYNYFQIGFEQYVFNIGKSVDNVWSVVCAPDSTMWFGGFLTGFWSFDKNNRINSFQSDRYIPIQKPGENANSFYMGGICDRQGRVYLPVNWGFLVIENSKPRYIATNNDGGVPMTMLDDNDNNRLILGQSDRFTIIEKGTWEIVYNSNLKQSVVSTCMTRDGNILAGTFRRQYILDKDSLKPFRPEQKLGVISMAKDLKGNIWKGTPVGLYFDNGVKDSALFDEKIRGSISAVFIKHPWLMVATVSKLYLVNIDSFYTNQTVEVLEYGKENGYIAMDGGQNGFCIDNEGYVWYPVADKVLRFFPEELMRNCAIQIPAPHLASVSFSKNAIEWERHELNDSILELNYRYNSVRFSMAAFSATRSDQINYQFRLRGLSDEWSQPTKIPQQTFTNLNPGSYQIEVRCSFNEQDWSPVIISPLVIIHKAWWQYWWAYMGWILMAVSILIYLTVLIAKQRQRIVIKKLSEQKRLNELRLQSVRSKHIPHFSGNALANIEHYIFSADLRQANKYLSKYSRLMNITLRDADKASRTIEQELEYVNLYLELEKMRFGDSLEYTVNVDSTVDLQKEIPNMMLQTWVENAVKHGIRHRESVGKIMVTLKNRDSKFTEISVEDNGIGRKKAHELGTSGTGQGLKILSEQITIYNQFNKEKIDLRIVDLTSREGTATGTRFEMSVPVDFDFNLSYN